MPRRCVAIAITATIAAATLALPRASHAQQASAALPRADHRLPAIVVGLELRRVRPLTKEQLAILDSQLGEAHAQIRALPQGKAIDAATVLRVKLALDARFDTLQAHLREARVAYTDQEPQVQRILREETAIRERQAELAQTR